MGSILLLDRPRSIFFLASLLCRFEFSSNSPAGEIDYPASVRVIEATLENAGRAEILSVAERKGR